ncbi:MAG: PEP-CTERM sorting domain-containing protein [Verrucomicrobiota bacterium]
MFNSSKILRIVSVISAVFSFGTVSQAQVVVDAQSGNNSNPAFTLGFSSIDGVTVAQRTIFEGGSFTAPSDGDLIQWNILAQLGWDDSAALLAADPSAYISGLTSGGNVHNQGGIGLGNANGNNEIDGADEILLFTFTTVSLGVGGVLEFSDMLLTDTSGSNNNFQFDIFHYDASENSLAQTVVGGAGAGSGTSGFIANIEVGDQVIVGPGDLANSDFRIANWSLDIVPEPSSYGFIMSGLALAFVFLRRRR